MLKSKLLFLVFFQFLTYNCWSQLPAPGIEQTQRYFPMLTGKKIGMVVHQASRFENSPKKTHLTDSLIQSGFLVSKIFAPEHGFKGKADAGEYIQDGKYGDIPIISLYGKNKKPNPEQMEDIDLMVFDLQDVGARFYTYLSTLHYIIEACAQASVPLLILDRPNPNGHYVDGPVLEIEHQSFVGMHSIPIVHGLTLGEMAQMIIGEKWADLEKPIELAIVPVSHYSHQTAYTLPIPPSPNLPNAQAVALYPSLCLLEPTVVSVGRGTSMQFQILGHPKFSTASFTFTPRPNSGAKYPKLNGEKCFGYDLRKVQKPKKIELKWLLLAYKHFDDPEAFFLKGFDRIAGTSSLRKQLKEGLSAADIRNSWEPALSNFKAKRKRYLIYSD